MKVLFICKNNQFRSQMAAAIYNKLTRSSSAFSAGTCVGAPTVPENETIEQFFRTPDFFELMEENGMFIRKNRTQKLSQKIFDESDVVVSMAEEPFIPDFLRESKDVIWWNVDNPTFVTHDVAKETYIKIHELVEGLIKR